MKYLNVLAKALYDNVAESPDELSFRKGDIMTVLERDTQGLDGWWLCSLHGRQGIVPGNRLKILVGMYDKKPAAPGPGPPATPPQPQPSLPQGVHTPVPPASQYSPMLPTAYQPQLDNVYLVPTPNKTQQGLYQAPGPNPQFQSPPAKQTSTFSKQTPHHSFPSPATDLYQVPPGPGSPAQDIYQVPPSAGTGHDIYQVPPSLDTRSWEGTKPPAKVRPTWHSCKPHGVSLGPWSPHCPHSSIIMYLV